MASVKHVGDFNNENALKVAVKRSKSGFYHLRKINKIRKYLSFKSAETRVHALVTSRLDFCNALLYMDYPTILWSESKGPERSGTDSHLNSQEGSYITSLVQATLVADTGKNSIQDTLNHIQGIK